jgi:hypothetical protein
MSFLLQCLITKATAPLKPEQSPFQPRRLAPLWHRSMLIISWL